MRVSISASPRNPGGTWGRERGNDVTSSCRTEHYPLAGVITGFRKTRPRPKVKETGSTVVFKDYAHAPSKVRASVRAVKELYPNREVVACVELHTFSSLNKAYLPQHNDSLKEIADGIVFFNPEKVKAKNLESNTETDIKNAFGNSSLKVFDDAKKLEEYLGSQNWANKNLLMMSSGNFAGFDIKTLAEKILA